MVQYISLVFGAFLDAVCCYNFKSSTVHHILHLDLFVFLCR